MDNQEEIKNFSKALITVLDSRWTKEEQDQIYQEMKAINDRKEPIWITKMLKSMLDDNEDPYYVLHLAYKYRNKLTDEQYQEVQDMTDDYLADAYLTDGKEY